MKKLFITAFIAVLCVSAFGQLDIVKRDLTATRQITIRDTALYDFVKRHGGSITLTTTGTSGAATLIGGVLNIPQYSGGGGEFPYAQTLTSPIAWEGDQNIGIASTNAGIFIGPDVVTLDADDGIISQGVGLTKYGLIYSDEKTVQNPRWVPNKSYVDSIKNSYQTHSWGADVASASTITPTGPMFKVTGTTTINTINLPYTGFSGEIKIVCVSGAVTLSNSGNIVGPFNTTPDRVHVLVYNPSDSKWYVSN